MDNMHDILKSWFKWVRGEQILTGAGDYRMDKSNEWRRGYMRGLGIAEAELGLAMLGVGMDYREHANKGGAT